MAKLSNLGPSLKSLAPRLSFTQDSEAKDKRVIDRASWHSWYKTGKWRKLRWATFVRDGFRCAMCQRIETDTSNLVADHRQPHRGDERLFWNPANIQTLCANPCHNKHKQQQEASAPLGIWY